MKNSYKTLLTTSITHEYGKFPKPFFEISPAPETSKTLINNALLYRKSEDSFSLLYSIVDESADLVKPLTEQLKLRFYLSLNFPEFHNITEIPFESSKIFYFSNKTSAKDGDLLPLHSESPGEEYVTDKDLYEFSSQNLRIDEESNDSIDYSLHDEDGNEVYAVNLSPVEGRIFHEYNFSHRPAGLYELRKNGIKDQVFYADNFLVKNRTFAVLEIHTGEEIPADYVITKNDGTVSQRDYILKFKSRSTTWRYIVIPQYTELEEDDTLVIEGNSEITFSSGVKETLPSGQSAFVFKSASVFPVKKEGQKNIALKKEDGVSKTLIDHLPNPLASSLSIEEEKVYSDIFVYI